MKSVLLTGGKGVRLAPITQITNKHLLPIYSKMNGAVPMVYYPIYTLIKSGISDILIISSREHCGQIINHLGDGSKFHANFSYKIQDLDVVPLGIASALRLAQDFTKDDDFAVILGDNFFSQPFPTECLLFENYHFSSCHLFVKAVSDPQRFGCATIDKSGNKIINIEEKPQNPQSNLAVTGLYLYDKSVYDIANKLKISSRGELEITDINNYYVQTNNSTYSEIKSFWHDCGTVDGMLTTQKWINDNDYTISFS